MEIYEKPEVFDVDLKQTAKNNLSCGASYLANCAF